MKVAVIFILCLGLTNFIETSTGQQLPLSLLSKDKADYHVRCIQSIAEKLEILKKCPESEKRTRKICLLEDLIHQMKFLSIDLKCTFKELGPLLNLPNTVLALILDNNIGELIEIIDIEIILNSCLSLVEGVLARVNILLKDQLTIINNLLGSTLNLATVGLNLHESITAVIASLTGTLLGSVLGLVQGLLGGGLLGGGLG
ncbi:uncharacterized protein LOC142152506 [Mixophyes fleayi]|uniref:uncharacterized protein LOC142152506 n=1 Tax=Mixophyes fleayi TaxID=3061075 RepID=UPI003F4DD3A6